MKHEFKKGGTYYTLRTDVNPVQVIKCVVTSSGRTYLKFTAEHDLSNGHKRNVEIYLDQEFTEFDGKNLLSYSGSVFLNKDEAIKGAKQVNAIKIRRAKALIDQQSSVEFEVLE